MDIIGAWFLLAQHLGDQNLNRVERLIEDITDRGGLINLIRREWMLDQENRGQAFSRHVLLIVILAVTFTLTIGDTVAGLAIDLGIAPLLGSLTFIWEWTVAIVDPWIFAVAFVVLVFGLVIHQVPDLVAWVRKLGLASAIAGGVVVFAILWPSLIPVAILYILLAPFFPFGLWLFLSPIHFGRWLKSQGDLDFALTGVGMFLLNLGFVLQFLSTL